MNSPRDIPSLVSCSGSLREIIQGVVAGVSGCVFTYGYSKFVKLFGSLIEIIQGVVAGVKLFGSLIEIIQGVVAGVSGCVFTYGYSKLGKLFGESNRNNSGCGSRCQWLCIHLRILQT